MAVIATAALASCQQEKSFNNLPPVDENSVVFTIQGGAGTRSADVVPEARQGVLIPLETEDGSRFVLEETVTSLDALLSETRGTPAYTENLGTLYANNLSVYAAEGNFGTATYENVESSLYPRKDESQGDGWRYHHKYNGNPWPESGAVGFYLNMPAEPDSVKITGRTGGKFTFTYTSLEKAADQQDILFAYRSMTKDEHKGFLPNGAPVLFNHALTAVKFAIGNTDTDISTNGIQITKITFKNLVNKGTCDITPVSEDNYRDNPTNYSSASAALWRDTTAVKGNTITSDTYSGTINYTSGENNKFGASWYSAGNNKNLNDADATQTFWLIPQTFTANSSVTLVIEYTFADKSDSWEIDFGKALAGVNWKAGDLRTYTIKVDEVNVKIEDTVTISAEQTKVVTDDTGKSHTIYGGTKNGIKITNTGNTDAFIRVALTGQWVDGNGAPVFSFTDFTVPDPAGYVIKKIASWYDDQFGEGEGVFGVFDGLVGYTKNNKTGAGNTGWVKGADGYYYYTEIVRVGQQTGTPVFNSYTVTLDNVPKIQVAGEMQDVHFVMDIATQAISAKNLDTSDNTWKNAWGKALGYDPTVGPTNN